ncbi:MAG: hypothetical protein ACFCVK_25530 [Acidimicrobiales bacterium]
MRLGRWAPRPLLRGALAGVGLRNPGHADDIRRVARPWGFTVDDVITCVPVAVWHAENDAEVPIGPWAGMDGLSLHRLAGDAHHPSAATWKAALDWAKSQLE